MSGERVTLQKCVEMMEDAKRLEELGFAERAAEVFADAYRLFIVAQDREIPLLLASHERWQWRAGMAVWALGDDGQPLHELRRIVWQPHGDYNWWLACDGDAYYQRSMADHIPVLDDAGTVGVLWGMLCDRLHKVRPTLRAGLDMAGEVTIMDVAQEDPVLYQGPLSGALLLVWSW